MSLSRPLGLQIPQELWTCKRPNYENLGIFGYEAFALVSKDDRRKLELRSQKCIFLGYGPEGEFGYRLWDPKNKQVVESLDVVFNKSKMHSRLKGRLNLEESHFRMHRLLQMARRLYGTKYNCGKYFKTSCLRETLK